MSYIGKIEEKLLAQKFRYEGKSYNEIVRLLNVSKSTVSRWCHTIELKPEQIELLSKNKKTGGWKGSIINAKIQRQKRIQQTDEINKKIKSIHKYGIFSIRICDKNSLRKINGWIKDILNNNFPGSSMVDAPGCGLAASSGNIGIKSR